MRTIITRCRTSNCLVLAVDGNINHEFDLAECLLSLAGEAASPHVILDLSEVTSLDLDAVAPLVAAYWAITDGGGRFSIVAPHQRVRMVLLLHALDWLIPVYDTTQDAEIDTPLLGFTPPPPRSGRPRAPDRDR